MPQEGCDALALAPPTVPSTAVTANTASTRPRRTSFDLFMPIRCRRRSGCRGPGRLRWMGGEEVREGVTLTNLDQPLFEGAGATKRDLVDYLDGAAERIIPQLRDRP